MEEFDLSQFTPEELQQILGLAGLGEQSDLLRQQLEQANALRSAGISQYSDPQAQAVGGIGSMASSLAGILGGMKTKGEMQDLSGQREAARLLYLDGLRRKGIKPRPGDMPAPGLPDLDTSVA